MNRVLSAVACMFLITSCGDPGSKSGENVGTATNNGTAPNNSAPNGNTGGPAPDNQCTCIWEGPVLFELQSAARVDDVVFLTAGLRWEPCCEPARDGERSWRVEPSGETESVASIPAEAEGLELPQPPAELVVPVSDTHELRIVQSAEDSVTSTSLDVGDVFEVVEGHAGDIVVDLAD